MAESMQDNEINETDKQKDDKPFCLIMLGMAGSGKSTLVQVSFQFKSPVFDLVNCWFVF